MPHLQHRIAVTVVAALAGCTGIPPLPQDDAVIARLNGARAEWEGLRSLAFEDYPSCQAQPGKRYQCPPFETMPADRREKYEAAARALHVKLADLEFTLVRAPGEPKYRPSDFSNCLEVTMGESGFPTTLQRKSLAYCEGGVSDNYLVPDIDAYLRDHTRKNQEHMLREVGDHWYIAFTPR